MKIKVKNAILSYASIWESYQPKTGEAKYSCKLICTPDTKIEVTLDDKKKLLPITKMLALFNRVCIDKWQKPVPDQLLENYAFNKADGSTTRKAYLNEDGDYRDGYGPDTWYFACSKKVSKAPKGIPVWAQDKSRLTASDGKLVSGDIVHCSLSLFAYEYENQKGISASLNGIQLVKTGTPFGAKAITDDEWDVEDEDELDDEGADGFGDEPSADDCL